MDTLAPYVSGFAGLLLFSSFIKILTTLSIVRYGVGLHDAGFGLTIFAVSLALSLLVMSPQLDAMGGVDALLAGKASKSYEKELRPFLEKHTADSTKEAFRRLVGSDRTVAAVGGVDAKGNVADDSKPKSEEGASATVKDESPLSFSALAGAFLISQVQEAFGLGLALLIPFIVVDLLVANVLMVLGVVQLPVAVVSLPLKLLLFFAVDGWTLVAEKLVHSFQ